MPDMNIFAYTLTNIGGFRDNKKQYKTKPKKNSQPNGMAKTHADKPHNCFNYKDPIHHL